MTCTWETLSPSHGEDQSIDRTRRSGDGKEKSIEYNSSCLMWVTRYLLNLSDYPVDRYQQMSDTRMQWPGSRDWSLHSPPKVRNIVSFLMSDRRIELSTAHTHLLKKCFVFCFLFPVCFAVYRDAPGRIKSRPRVSRWRTVFRLAIQLICAHHKVNDYKKAIRQRVDLVKTF